MPSQQKKLVLKTLFSPRSIATLVEKTSLEQAQLLPPGKSGSRSIYVAVSRSVYSSSPFCTHPPPPSAPLGAPFPLPPRLARGVRVGGKWVSQTRSHHDSLARGGGPSSRGRGLNRRLSLSLFRPPSPLARHSAASFPAPTKLTLEVCGPKMCRGKERRRRRKAAEEEETLDGSGLFPELEKTCGGKFDLHFSCCGRPPSGPRLRRLPSLPLQSVRL